MGKVSNNWNINVKVRQFLYFISIKITIKLNVVGFDQVFKNTIYNV